MAWPVASRRAREFKPIRRAQAGYLGAAMRAVLFGGGTARERLTHLLARRGETVANYQPGVGVVGTLNASRWYNALGTDIALVLPGVAANYASAPDSPAISITGNLIVVVDARMQDWTPTTQSPMVSKRSGTAGSRSFITKINPSGTLELTWSADGTAETSVASTALPPLVDGARYLLGYAFDVDNDAVGSDATFWYSTDSGATWTKIGATVTTAGVTAIFDSDAILEIGTRDTGTVAGNAGVSIYRVQMYSGSNGTLASGINGTLAFDADFSTHAKDTTSFAESANAATVTINSTAIAVPARIGDATDLCQSIAASQPTINADGTLTFDGTADYMKTAAFTLNQPETVYLVGKQVTWTGYEYILDGDTTASIALFQTTATPQICWFAGTEIATGALALNTKAIITGVINGASSSITINSSAPTTGNAGSNNAGGFTVARQGGAAAYGNIEVDEIIIRKTADSAALQAQIIALENAIHGVF